MKGAELLYIMIGIYSVMFKDDKGLCMESSSFNFPSYKPHTVSTIPFFTNLSLCKHKVSYGLYVLCWQSKV